MRAFRPSYFAPLDGYEEEQQRQRDENLRQYRERAEAGLPLFESSIPFLAEALRRAPFAK